MRRGSIIKWGKTLFSAALLAAGFLMVGKTGVETEAAMVLANPRIVEDVSMEAGQKVTWDCIWFGSYPQAEVVTSAMRENYTALGESLLVEEDLVVSDSVYGKLEAAEGWDSRNDIVLDGVKYRRMKEEDAIYLEWGNKEYYDWPEDGSWHYFRYEPIKWRILSVDGGQAFLWADRVLDDQPYNTVYENVTWETSTVRSWLNGYGTSANGQGQDYTSLNFLSSAFTSEEQSAIFSTPVVNADNMTLGTEGGQDTLDKLFFLSEKEMHEDEQTAVYGFAEAIEDDEARRKRSSIYAKARGLYINNNDGDGFTGNSRWWLRSPGLDADYATDVDCSGWVDQYGNFVDYMNVGVCPALHLNLSSTDLYSYAGTVSSDGTVIKNIALCKASIADAIYTGDPQTPQVIVDDGDTVLKKGIDYTVTFSQNTEAGTARAEITGIGSYMGTLVKEFSIGKTEQTLRASLSPGSIQVGESALITANGKGALSFTSDNTAVAAVDARGQVTGVSPGIAKITVTAAGDRNYNPGSAVLDIAVTEKTGIVGIPETGENPNGSSDTGFSQPTKTPSNITKQVQTQTITAFSKTVVYKSKPFSLKVKASGNGKLTYKSNNKKVATVSAKGRVTVKGYGEAKITIKAAAKGNYSEATKKVTIKVVPKAPKFVNTKKSKIKPDKTVSGYEVYFSTEKNFKKNVQKGIFGKNAHGMRMVGLKRNVNYYVKARAYKKVGGKMYYSAWSKVVRLKQ